MKLWTIDEVAEILRVHRNTIYTWRAEGKFPNTIRIQNTIRIPQSDIDALIESGKAS